VTSRTAPAQEADPAFLKDPARFAPFVYDQRRLLALPADGCYLPFQSGSFDVVYSLSSIEHFGGHQRASEAMREMNRLLSPGGTACVATELVLEGGPHPAYSPSRPSPAPHHGCFAPGSVIPERVRDRVIPALEDAVFVVADRLGAHHAHPSQAGTTPP